jgi:putative hydrolase of the HAD superfamily
MTLRAILLDLDETLLEEEAPVREAFLATGARARERFGLDPEGLHARQVWRSTPNHPWCREIGISSWEGLWGRFEGEGRELALLRAWVPAYRREAWYRGLREMGVVSTPFAEELAALFPEERSARHRLFPEVPVVLEELGGEFPLFLVTNGAADVQREKIARTHLAGYFNAVVISGELGFGKPDPKIFRHALERAGVRPEEAVMAGDSLRRDVAGARAAGLHAVWVNRAGASLSGGGTRPDAEIRSLAQLRSALP